MNFFDFFRRKKEPRPAEQSKVLLPDGKLASSKLAAVLPQLEPLVRPCIRITASAANDLLLFDSKFGGYPYWPAEKPWPKDSEGRYMYPLAQLNFSQVPPLPGYPEKGILQFYLSADDLYGLNMDHQTDQTNFRVVYYEDTRATALDNFHFLEQQQSDSDFPVHRQMELSFSVDKDYYSFFDVRFEGELPEEFMAGVQHGKEYAMIEDELVKLYPDDGHKIGGYAFFTQSDPRHNEAYRDYILLLQIDSQADDICWGDAGVGNFFIHPDDLVKKDFSRVLYNWDCT